MPRMPRSVLAALLLAAPPLVTSCVGDVIEGTSEAIGGSSSSGAGNTTGGATGSTSDDPGESTSTGTTAEPTSAGPSTGIQTTGMGICGDGAVDPGEVCDDGNRDDSDDCTSMCAAPSCSDALKNGSESAVDCGGACPKCAGGNACIVDEDCLANSCDDSMCAPVARSCLELLMMVPGLPNETYGIDPEGDGSLLQVYCDMQGGGWTQVARETGDMLVGWSAGNLSNCGALGQLLGGVGQFGPNVEAQKSFMLLNVPHSETRVVAGVVIIDSWDDEKISAELDGQEVASRICKYDDANTCGQQQNQCGGGGFNDGRIDLVGQRAHAGDMVLVKLRSNLNEDANNESWGLDALTLFVK